jgi:hypothetical protein
MRRNQLPAWAVAASVVFFLVMSGQAVAEPRWVPSGDPHPAITIEAAGAEGVCRILLRAGETLNKPHGERFKLPVDMVLFGKIHMSHCNVGAFRVSQERAQFEKLVGDGAVWVRDRDHGYPEGAFVGHSGGPGPAPRLLVCAGWIQGPGHVLGWWYGINHWEGAFHFGHLAQNGNCIVEANGLQIETRLYSVLVYTPPGLPPTPGVAHPRSNCSVVDTRGGSTTHIPCDPETLWAP